MREYNSNYLGLCINNDDPERRGRVQIFIPHIMPALYDKWNEAGEDIEFTAVGDNLINGLNAEQVEKLKSILPWAEAASPIIGTSAPGNIVSQNIYDSSPVGEIAPFAESSGVFNTRAALLTIDSDNAGLGYCARGVANILRKQGLGEFGGLNAHDMYKRTNSQGWVKLPNATPENAPEGALLLFDSDVRKGKSARNKGGGRYGHAEIVGNNNGKRVYLSDTARSNFGGSVPDNFMGAWVKAGGSSGGQFTDPAFTQNKKGTAQSGERAAINPFYKPNPFDDIENPLYGSFADPTAENKAATTIKINETDIKEVGPKQQRKVSTYGSVWQDLTSYLDVFPDQRPKSATQYWESQGKNIAKVEADLRNSIPGWKPSLDFLNTGTGSGATFNNDGNLTPGLSIAVPRNNRYNLPLGSFVRIKDRNGQPIGGNGGIFQIADVGSEKNLADKLNAVDFYYGNDINLKKYFTSLNSKEVLLDITPIEIEGETLESLKTVLGQQENVALNELTETDISGFPSIADGSMVNNIDRNGATVTLDVNDTAKGVFSFPAAGAMLWVFFREGNPLFPVYFAASYSQAEWSSVYNTASPGESYNPVSKNGEPVSVGGQMNFPGGGLRWQNTFNANDRNQDQQSMMVYGEDGSNMFMGKGYHQLFSKFDRRDQVEGDRFDSTLGYKQTLVQGQSDQIVMGDKFIKVGNVSPTAVNAVLEIQKLIKEIQEPLSRTT